MRLLLDTHLLLWALEDDPRLPEEARRIILDQANDIFASSVSLWEIAIKSGLGKLEADAASVLRALPSAGFESLAFSGEHAVAVGKLPGLHRDPFDRALVAQARCEPMVLLTHDPQVGAYGDGVRLV